MGDPHDPQHHPRDDDDDDDDDHRPNQEEGKEGEEEDLSYDWILKAASQRRRTWVALFLAAYAALIAACWHLLQFVGSRYVSEAALPSAGPWPEIYASALFGGLFGLLSMAAALAVAVPAMVVTWIAVLVLLACAGKSRRQLLRDGRRATGDIVVVAAKVLVREGKLVAAACAVVSFFALLYRRHHLHDS